MILSGIGTHDFGLGTQFYRCFTMIKRWGIQTGDQGSRNTVEGDLLIVSLRTEFSEIAVKSQVAKAGLRPQLSHEKA